MAQLGRNAIAPEAVRHENETSDRDGIEVDWTSASCALWQTPKDPRLLTMRETEKEIHTESSLYRSDKEQENREQSSPTDISEADKEVNESQVLNSGLSKGEPNTLLTLQTHNNGCKVTVNENEEPLKIWSSSRRRPILQKKKTVSSAGAKFELAAEKKVQLIKYQQMVAENLIEQNRKEHDLRMEILKLKKENELLKNKMLREGNLVFEV